MFFGTICCFHDEFLRLNLHGFFSCLYNYSPEKNAGGVVRGFDFPYAPNGTGIFTYSIFTYHKFEPNVGKNIPYMEHLGF